jgi:phospholipid transport system substrate-binding protein
MGLPGRWMRALCLAALACLPLMAAAQAQPEAPDKLVSRVSGEVLDILAQSGSSPGSSEVQALVREKVLPHFDFTRMTSLAAGLSWRKATPAQQTELVEQFRTLLVRTYSSALGKYQGQKLEFDPLRESADKKKAIVRSRLLQSGSQAITVDYRMALGEDGWKIFDVAVDGVSLVTTYRDSFSEEARNNGIDGLIRMLADKNASLRAKAG